MKTIKHVALVMGLVLLAGCATTFRPWKLSDIQEGMDRAQVVAILGKPDSTETTDEVEVLYYSYSEDYNPPLADDTNRSIDNPTQRLQDRQFQNSFKEYKYSVKLVDGKVQNYKELTE